MTSQIARKGVSSKFNPPRAGMLMHRFHEASSEIAAASPGKRSQEACGNATFRYKKSSIGRVKICDSDHLSSLSRQSLSFTRLDILCRTGRTISIIGEPQRTGAGVQRAGTLRFRRARRFAVKPTFFE